MTESQPWPYNALSEAQIDAVFDLMFATYGDRFVRKWAEAADPEFLRRTWAVALHRVPVQLGMERLSTYPHPPDLPEFIRLCAPDRVEPAHRQAMLDLPAAMNREHQRANLARLKGEMAKLDQARGGIAWAYAVRERVKASRAVSPAVAAMAEAAIAQFEGDQS
ncbi:hypothetical protein [Cupriavidus sp. AcVe19-6a]|uniref:hypothetical protein n=1 Tax=Cupriavidus sp. AcVe19-6a TaxID=2821358 RepID=UPI001AE8F6E0|nr:hypothetical protein [Cupriavidus sp. AcVe19-6a]MBP0634884.1 hypothetical protein [Cupriavidus sp. AcVe19-6a]